MAMVDAAPPATEVPACPVCELPSEGIEIGTRGRFNMPVRNIACAGCALVYQSPRPSVEAMAAYYSGAYRLHYGQVRYPIAGGGSAAPGEPGYQAALESWHVQQASNALELGKTRPGARVLEIGCRHGRTLVIMRERLGITAYGIEPGPAEAEQARAAGVSCFTGALESYDPGDVRFDQIQSFHVLEHLHDPLGALLRLRNYLAPGGQIIIEVPNVYQPYGLLEENFFQNAHLTNFSAVTLRALLLRAGLATRLALDSTTLFAVAEMDWQAGALPRPFDAQMLAQPTHTAPWVSERLRTYAALEKQRLALKQQGPSMELIAAIVQSLDRPSFGPHTIATVCEMVEYFLARDAPRLALLVGTAASQGPQAPDVRAHLQDLANRLTLRLSAPETRPSSS
jgi:SAM-dependent methyltransferase